MITGTDANMGTTPVRLEHLFDEQALVAWMVGNVEGFAEMYQNRLRIKAYPAYSASIGNIKVDLANLETIDDFVPNV